MKREQPRDEEPAEQLGEHVDRKKEGRPRRDPARAVERDPAARHDHVDVRVVGQRRPSASFSNRLRLPEPQAGSAPGLERGGDADAGAEVTRVGGDRQHGLRCRPEQQIVNRGLVVEGDVGDLGRYREDDVEVADRQ